MFFKALNTIIRTFDQLKTGKIIRSNDEISILFIKTFDQLTKNEFGQTPKFLQNFDQLKMSSEIRSSDRFPQKINSVAKTRIAFKSGFD